MNLNKLLIGTILLILGYAFLVKSLTVITDDALNISLRYLPFLEGIVYSIVILVALEFKKSLEFVLIALAVGILNFSLVLFGTPLVGTAVGYMLEFAGFTYSNELGKTLLVIQLSILGAVGALIFCLVLYAWSAIRWLTVKMSFLVALLCSFSAVSAFFFYTNWFFIINKTIWWAMFSLGIFISANYLNKHNQKTSTAI